MEKGHRDDYFIHGLGFQVVRSERRTGSLRHDNPNTTAKVRCLAKSWSRVPQTDYRMV